MAMKLGLTGGIGTCAEVVDNKYTGAINGTILHGVEKVHAIETLAKDRNVKLEDCFAYSDSHNDIPLLNAVGSPRAINPDAKLRIIALAHGWPIHDFRRLRVLNRLLGPFISRVAGFWTFITSRTR